MNLHRLTQFVKMCVVGKNENSSSSNNNFYIFRRITNLAWKPVFHSVLRSIQTLIIIRFILFIYLFLISYAMLVFIHTSTKRKKKKKKKKRTGNSYNLIANHFHVKTASKFKFIRKRKKRFFFFFFFKRGSFRSAQVGKAERRILNFLKGGSFGVAQVETVE